MLTGSCVLRPGFWEDVWGMLQEGVAFSQFLSPHREETPAMAARGAGIWGALAVQVPAVPRRRT